MRSIYFALFLGSLPLEAQNSLNDTDGIHPTQAPESQAIRPDETPGPITISTNTITLPAPPLSQPMMDRVAITPGTVRESLNYPAGIHTILTLTKPATKEVAYRVTSSDPAKLLCGPITFEKGDQEKTGVVEVKWKAVDEDCAIVLKVYDPDHPERILRSRIYLRKAQIKPEPESP